jgi:hypothetical protein
MGAKYKGIGLTPIYNSRKGRNFIKILRNDAY